MSKARKKQARCVRNAAVHAGARQVEGAMNGIGERAGNCS
ncbi:hypothetical protein, partial [Enterobacter roggenkampii]